MVVRVDLRVHAGAPSSRKDDDQFTAQAEAYLMFQSERSHSLLAPQTTTTSQEVPQSFAGKTDHDQRESPEYADGRLMIPPTSSHGREETTIMTWDPTTFLEDTQLGYSALESQLITSALPISKTPGSFVARQRTSLQREIISLDSYVEPVASPKVQEPKRRQSLPVASSSSPQVPSQSSYLTTPVLDRPTKKARRSGKTALRTPYSLEISAPPDGFVLGRGRSSHEAIQSTGYQNALYQTEEESAGNDTTSELPTSYSLSNITTDSSRSNQQSVQRSVSDPGPLIDDSLHAARSCDQQAESIAQLASSTRLNVVQEVQPESHPALSQQVERPQSISPIAVRDSAATVKPPLKATTAELPDTIMPPSPVVSMQPLESHVTSTLRMLIENSDIANRYELVTQTRGLRDTERGHWLLNVSNWSAQLQVDFLRYLTRMIGEGRLGWGVWCVREAADAGKSLVRVYCWGELVRHIYLLLYVASKSKVRRLGLQWIDAAGEVVVQMRGLDHAGRAKGFLSNSASPKDHKSPELKAAAKANFVDEPA